MIREICERIGFPQEAIFYLEEQALRTDKAVFDEIFQQYLDCEPTVYFASVQQEADRLQLPVVTVNLLFLLHLFPELHRRYTAAGVPEDVFWATAEDFRYKLEECLQNHGVWGNGALKWYRKFFDVNLVKLGRLQYHIIPWAQEDFGDIKQGDTVFNLHIPSAGPLKIEDVEASFETAKEFFRQRGVLKTDYFPLVCHSWLLYPNHRELFPEGSNLRKFHDLFTLVKDNETNIDFERIFHQPDAGCYENLPQNTQLQRNFAAYLRAGGKMGQAWGIIIR